MECKRKRTSRRPGSGGGRRLSSSGEVRFGKSALSQGCPGRVGQRLNSRLGKHWLGLPPEHRGHLPEHRDEGQPSFYSPHPAAECSDHPWGPLCPLSSLLPTARPVSLLSLESPLSSWLQSTSLEACVLSQTLPTSWPFLQENFHQPPPAALPASAWGPSCSVPELPCPVPRGSPAEWSFLKEAEREPGFSLCGPRAPSSAVLSARL